MRGASTAQENEWVAALVRRRSEQDKFRERLLDAYSGTCAITGYDTPDALQGAHILAYFSVDAVGNVETTRAWDIDGDGQLEIVPKGTALQAARLLERLDGERSLRGTHRQLAQPHELGGPRALPPTD